MNKRLPIDDELMEKFLDETEKRLRAQKHHATANFKNNARKCKSCVFFKDGECLSNPERPEPRPMDMACKLHKKRK